VATLGRTAKLAVDASPREAALIGALFVVGALMPTVQLHLSQRFVDQAFGYAASGHKTGFGVSSGALATIIAITVVGVIYAAVNAVANARTEVFMETVTARVTEDLYSRVATMDIAYHDDPRWHDALARATEGVTYRPRQLVMGTTMILGSGVGAIGMLGLVATLNPWLMVIVLLPAVFNVLIQRRVTKARFAFYYDAAERNREQHYIGSLLTETANARDVRAYGLAPMLVDRYTALRILSLRLLAGILRRVSRVSMASGLATGLATGFI
jgi:ATP-binding cassette subfamily B protein/ATP-binding cassette subfamily C protein